MKPMSRNRKVQILKAARARLDRPYGWRKHVFKTKPRKDTGYPQFCLIGAINDAYTEIVGTSLAESDESVANDISITSLAGTKTVTNKWGDRSSGRSIPSFNDAFSTTKQDVLALIDERIDQLKKEK